MAATKRRWVAAWLVCAVCACGGDSEPAGDSQGGAGTGSGGGPQGVDACSIVTQADASALFGQPAVQDQEDATIVDPALLGECLWTWDTDTSNQLLQFFVWDGPEYHSMPDAAEPFAVGEQGYIAVNEFLGIDIEWIQGGRTIVLSYSNVGPDAPELSTKVEPMKALAQSVSGKL